LNIIGLVQGSKHGAALALQLTDVSLRVEDVREYALQKSVGLLLEPSLITVRESFSIGASFFCFIYFYLFSLLLLNGDGAMALASPTRGCGNC